LDTDVKHPISFDKMATRETVKKLEPVTAKKSPAG